MRVADTVGKETLAELLCYCARQSFTKFLVSFFLENFIVKALSLFRLHISTFYKTTIILSAGNLEQCLTTKYHCLVTLYDYAELKNVAHLYDLGFVSFFQKSTAISTCFN